MNPGYEFRVLNGAEEILLWENAIDSISSANFFHTNVWLSFVEKQFRLKLKRVLILNSGSIEGCLPLYERKYGFFKIAGSPLIAENNPYMGFAIKEKEGIGSFLPAFNRFLREERIDFFRASFDHSLYNDQFENHGYDIKEKKSFRIDLSQDEQLLWKGLGQKTRNMVRKAMKNDIVASEDLNFNMLDSYYEMSREVYARQVLPPLLEIEYYQNLYSAIIKKGYGKIFIAKNTEGDAVAGAIVLIHMDKAYYLDGASFRNHSNLGTNNLLQWVIIKSLKESGVTSYDMLGGDIPGIAKFKKSFGAINHPTLYVEKSVSAMSGFARKVYAKQKDLSKKIFYAINRLKNRGQSI